MMTSDDKVGGWVKKGQNHDDVLLELSLIEKICLKHLKNGCYKYKIENTSKT